MVNTRRSAMLTGAALALAGWTSVAIAQDAKLDDVVEKSFYPYKNGFLSHDFAKPGVVIDKGNLASARDLLSAAWIERVGLGEMTVKVGNPLSLAAHPNYVAATQKDYKTVKLRDDGNLEGYVAGRPFPQEPDASDPNAGLKIAFNYKYFHVEGDSQEVTPFFWSYKNMDTGEVERRLRMTVDIVRHTRRVVFEPMPNVADNPGNIYNSFRMVVSEPFDVSNTQVLIYRYEDDQQRDDAWLYLGFQRRVRRLGTGQTTDSFLGTDLMIEDFRGYNTRNSDYSWKYLGTETKLLGMSSREMTVLEEVIPQPDGYKWIGYHGQGNCFANHAWTLRKTHVVEATPKETGHPISKRIIYFDAESYAITDSFYYDQAGKLWRLFPIGYTQGQIQDPVKNKGWTGPAWEQAAGIDVQKRHCTTLQFRVSFDPADSPLPDQTVQALRVQGR